MVRFCQDLAFPLERELAVAVGLRSVAISCTSGGRVLSPTPSGDVTLLSKGQLLSKPSSAEGGGGVTVNFNADLTL